MLRVHKPRLDMARARLVCMIHADNADNADNAVDVSPNSNIDVDVDVDDDDVVANHGNPSRPLR